MAGDDETEQRAREKEKDKQRRDAREAERARFEQLAKDNDALREELQRLRAQGATAGSSGDDLMSVPDADNSTLSNQQLAGLLQGIQTTMEGLRTVLGTGQQASGGPRQPAPPVERKAAKDVLKGKLRALNVRAADMAQELDAFFRPIETYFKASNLADMANAEQDAERILILEGTMGESCIQAMAGTTDANKATYTLYKEAIKKRFLTEYDPVHIMVVLIQCTMLPTETTKDYVTRLWGHVKRLTDLPAEWLERLILVMLRLGHARPPVRDLLMEKKPASIADAEKICEEFETRQQQKPVAAKFVEAMSSAGSSVPVDNVNARGATGGGYRGPKNRGRGGQARGGGGQNQRPPGDAPTASAGCFRCGKPGHIARYCQAPTHSMLSNPAGASGAANPSNKGRGGGQSNRGGQQRYVSNVGTHPFYSDYAANQEQLQYPGWNPSYLPEFPQPDVAAEVAYADEVEATFPPQERLTYGLGSPHRQAAIDDATVRTSCAHSDWWTPIHFPRCDYLIKVDTGARVNVISVADLSRLGYMLRDLVPSSVYLVGFNRAVVRPLGQLIVRVTVNNRSFDSCFHVVERCNSPLLCLRDAERAGLVCVSQPVVVGESNTAPGTYKHEIVSLKLRDDAVPKQFPPRKVPLALQAQARAQLDEMLRDGVVERVTEPSEWVHPMQIAFKPDGRLRICMDPRYLNQFLERAIFPFPSLDQVFSSIKGAKYFSKIDLTWGFWNLLLDEESSKLCTFVTPWGVFRYKRLPFGVSPAPEVFHRVLADVLRDIPGVIHYVDDVLVYGATLAEHDERLQIVLRRLIAAGFAISDTKCSFRKQAVVFLGHLLSGEKIRPDPSKVAAILQMRPPTNISEHRGLMGFVNFLSQFLPHYSSITEPLRRLQSGKSLFRWSEDQQRSFDLLKRLFAREPCLAPFDQQADVSLATDASSTGLGAVLLQHGRPVMYVARSLTEAEKRYSTIEKELLAVVFALQRCHFYTFGRPVKILTDHRSLLGLVGADLESMTPRLRRFTERLFPYALSWEYIPGKDNYIPDYLSRMSPRPPAPAEVSEALTFDAADTRFTRLLLGGGPFYENLATSSLHDPTLTFLRACIEQGWPRRAPVHIQDAARYWPMRYRLRVSGPFVLVDDDRVCVPASMTAEALTLFHQGHPGVGGMQNKLRRVLYWPGWTKAVKDFVLGCVPCAGRANSRPQPETFTEAPPEFPGEQVAADHFVFGPECYLACVDVFSGFPFLFRCKSPSAASLIPAMQQVFLQTGLPRVLLSDRGPAFMSEAFQNFLKSCSVRHRASTPQYAQSNGAAERAVQTLKHLRAKCSSVSQLFQAVLQLQNTPRGLTHATPAELFLGRTQRTTADPVPRQYSQPWTRQLARLQHQQSTYPSPTRSLRPLTFLPGSTALLRDFFGVPARVVVVGYGDAPRSYKIRLPSGVVTERNSSFLFPLPRTSRTTTSVPSTPPSPLTKKIQETLSPAAGSSARTAGTPLSSHRTCVSQPVHRPSSAVPPTAVLAPSPSQTASYRHTAPVSWQVDPGLPSDKSLSTGRSDRTPTTASSVNSAPGSNVTNRAGTAAGAAKRLVRPTARMLASAQQGFQPAQLFVRRHRPPPGLVARPNNWHLAESTPLPPSPPPNSSTPSLSSSPASPPLRPPKPNSPRTPSPLTVTPPPARAL